MFAIVEIAGKHFLVESGQRLKVDALHADKDTISFDKVLLVGGGDSVKIGQPLVSGAAVKAKVLRDFRDTKVTVLKYKPKVRYRKKYGHRQSKTELEITDIKG